MIFKGFPKLFLKENLAQFWPKLEEGCHRKVVENLAYRNRVKCWMTYFQTKTFNDEAVNDLKSPES